jgi:cobalt-zinc-cadmium efflux system outer membrane protein
MMFRVLPLICALPFAALAAELPQPTESLTLAQALSFSIEHNRDLKLSDLAVDSAQAAVTMASAAPNPLLSVQVSGINPGLGVGAGPWRNKTVDSNLRIDQLIERGGKRALRTTTAMQLENAAHDDARDVMRQLRLLVGQAYFDLLGAQQRLQVSQDTVALFESTISAAQRRKNAGDLSAADLARLQVDALRSKNDLRRAESDRAQAQLTLALVMGRTAPAHTLNATDDWPSPESLSMAGDLEQVIAQRPDVRAAKARVEAAQTAHKLALASRTRDVSVGIQFDHYPNSPSNNLGGGNSYGIGVQIPLFVRYYFEGEIRSAQATLDSANEQLEKTRERARNELSRTMDQARLASEQVRRFQGELLDAARQSSQAAEYAFLHGAIDVMGVLDARRTYHATQLEAINAQQDFAKALAAWRITVSEGTHK